MAAVPPKTSDASKSAAKAPAGKGSPPAGKEPAKAPAGKGSAAPGGKGAPPAPAPKKGTAPVASGKKSATATPDGGSRRESPTPAPKPAPRGSGQSTRSSPTESTMSTPGPKRGNRSPGRRENSSNSGGPGGAQKPQPKYEPRMITRRKSGPSTEAQVVAAQICGFLLRHVRSTLLSSYWRKWYLLNRAKRRSRNLAMIIGNNRREIIRRSCFNKWKLFIAYYSTQNGGGMARIRKEWKTNHGLYFTATDRGSYGLVPIETQRPAPRNGGSFNVVHVSSPSPVGPPPPSRSRDGAYGGSSVGPSTPHYQQQHSSRTTEWDDQGGGGGHGYNQSSSSYFYNNHSHQNTTTPGRPPLHAPPPSPMVGGGSGGYSSSSSYLQDPYAYTPPSSPAGSYRPPSRVSPPRGDHPANTTHMVIDLESDTVHMQY